ncbi:hypothetical protein KSP40_PGU016569 [Platanthera guangdongensis]|uniref:Ribosomal protein L34e superfamily protein n=1 Tax=Platanthera guangdongensis TaxID=2320717 RepID=A0ABR2LRE8_9ASPA
MPAASCTPAPAVSQSQRPHKKKSQLDSQNSIKSPPCPHRKFPIVDICILIAVLSACGFLLFPYLKMFSSGLSDFWKTALATTGEELGIASGTFAVIGIGFLVACSVLYLAVDCCAGQKCDNPNCRGLRNAPEFDIKIETEDCLKILNNSAGIDGVESGFFELGEDYNRELGAKLKKMAPLNGRAVLIFRSKCGCSAGRMVVWGQKKSRKAKKMKASESDFR